MKEVEIKVIMRCTDDFYNSDASNMVADIKSGKFQREAKSEGVTKLTATVKVRNAKNK